MDVLIVGASGRASAESALRAGLVPHAIDLFNDCDLPRVGQVRRIESSDYPDGLARIADELPMCPVVYTGAVENHPELVDRLAAKRHLWGNPGGVLRAVRDPFAVARVLSESGLPHPRVRATLDGLPRDGSWLLKPRASASGRGIRPLGPDDALSEGWYAQERIDGPSFSAVCVGHGGGRPVRGVTKQRVGGKEGGPGFVYLGSIGPVRLETTEQSRVDAIAHRLASAFGLVGLFGIDFVERDGRPWVVEVNPRPTASIEVLELALGRALWVEHVAAFAPGIRLDPLVGDRRHPPGVVGKATLYARRPCVFPSSFPWRPSPLFAVSSPSDVPRPGTSFRAGEPVLTVRARGGTIDDCERRLRQRLTHWERIMSEDESPSSC